MLVLCFELVRERLEVRQVVVAAGDDDVGLQSPSAGRGRASADWLFSSSAMAADKRRIDMLLVADRRLARGRDDLAPCSRSGRHGSRSASTMSLALASMVVFGLEVRVAGAVAENLQALLQVVVAEHVLEGGVHARPDRHFGIVGAALVDDLQRDAVLDRLAHRVLVDVVAEDALGLVDRRAGVADAAPRSGCPCRGWRRAASTASDAPRQS